LRFIYTAFFYCLLPIILLRLLWRGVKSPAYWQRWSERFGFITPLSTPQSIWIHAVSMGEVQAAIPLIRALQQQFPQLPLLITTMTPTGSKRVRETFAHQVNHFYLPYDLPDAMGRFLRRTQPKLLILIETEIWPNLLHACQQHAIPVLLANARLSARSAAGYQRIYPFIRSTLQKITAIAAQTQADADRFIMLGYPADNIIVTGSIKFDFSLPKDIVINAQSLRQQWGEQRIVWIAASTHEGEEEVILSAFNMIRQQIPTLLLILVPRHPERFNRVAQLCQRFSYQVIRRSHQQSCSTMTDIYLGDSMGELLLLYAASDFAYVGGSWTPIGGHNLLEPAALGLPVIIGVHTHDFTEISEKLLAVDAARRVHNIEELNEAILFYSTKPLLRKQAGERGQLYVKQNQGALSRLLAVIQKRLF